MASVSRPKRNQPDDQTALRMVDDDGMILHAGLGAVAASEGCVEPSVVGFERSVAKLLADARADR